jgi:hypothetical protein
MSLLFCTTFYFFTKKSLVTDFSDHNPVFTELTSKETFTTIQTNKLKSYECDQKDEIKYTKILFQ